MTLLVIQCLFFNLVAAQMIGQYSGSDDQNPGAIALVNGRIFTPGLAIIASPQPNTPMGGDFLHVALDISGDGALPFPPDSRPSASTQFHNITLFLTSNIINKNFTISNGTTSTPPFANILRQETGSTVKHINFEWPLCLVGDGNDSQGSARGSYNISIHQSFRLNGSDFYTIFNLPISITNQIEQFPGANQLLTNPKPGPLSANGGRMDCGMIENNLLSQEDLLKSVTNPNGQPFGESGTLEIENTGSGGGQVGGNGEQGGGSNGGQNTGSNGGQNTGSNNGQNTGSNGGQNTGSNGGQNTGSNGGQNTGSNGGQNTGSNGGQNVGLYDGQIGWTGDTSEGQIGALGAGSAVRVGAMWTLTMASLAIWLQW